MNKKILIVDDDEAIVEALKLTTEMEGYRVKTASKAEEVFPMVCEFCPDLVILDILLDGEDGRIVCQSLKSNLQTQNIPVIMISAHPTMAKTVEDYGADDFLPKPFDINDLLKRISKFTQ
ncbi:MAG: response regulator transcription factor [bacterium]|nr:response regulator transcription factor [bacterium]